MIPKVKTFRLRYFKGDNLIHEAYVQAPTKLLARLSYNSYTQAGVGILDWDRREISNSVPEFPSVLPTTQAEGLKVLRDIKRRGDRWHLDDNPRDIVNHASVEVFNKDQCLYIDQLVPRLNELFANAGPKRDRGTINAGAWAAAVKAGWLKD